MEKEKVCSVCGRSFAWRKKWAAQWEQIKYCSDRCRDQSRGRHRQASRECQRQILELLAKRGPGKTICPSEILPQEARQNRESMECVRQAARLLAHQGLIEITQKGKPVDPDDFRGPIRLKMNR